MDVLYVWSFLHICFLQEVIMERDDIPKSFLTFPFFLSPYLLFWFLVLVYLLTYVNTDYTLQSPPSFPSFLSFLILKKQQ